jgi:copper(I)-binding protein
LKRIFSSFAALTLVCFAALASSHEYTLGNLFIEHPWAMPTAPTATTGAGYLVLKNKGNKADRLISASAGVANKVELHTHIKEGDVLKMRPVDAIDIPAGGETKLEPGGLHIMLIGLKKPLEEGQRFPVVLKFENAGEITVDLLVQKGSQPEHKH